MKKIILSATMFTVLVLASCGKSAVCDCAETGLAMMTEAKEAKMDPTKMAAIQEKYKGDFEKCEKLDEGKTEEEKIAMEEELYQCESFQKLEKLNEEITGKKPQRRKRNNTSPQDPSSDSPDSISDSEKKVRCLRMFGGVTPGMSAWEQAQAECLGNNSESACECMEVLSK